MFGKREKPKRQTRTAASLAQYGIFEVPESIDDLGKNFMKDDDDDDGDLEAELAALTASDDVGLKPKRRAPRRPVPDANLDAMVAESMKDIQDEDVSDGDDDPELLNELQMITGDESPETVSPEEEENVTSENIEPSKPEEGNTSMEKMIQLLQERLRLYQIAEKKAKQENESGRARRFNRGIKTLKGLLHDAHSGKVINEADIPPQLPPSATTESTEKVPQSNKEEPMEHASPPVEVDTTPSAEDNTPSELVPTKTIDEAALNLLKSRQQEYKVAAVAWKRSDNMKEALQCVKIAKQFDIVIAAVNAGEEVDLSDMPPSPNTLSSDTVPTMEPKKEENEVQGQSSTETPPAETKPSGVENLELALKERLEVYRRTKTAAETEGNSSKARRYGRICKQFEDALKLHARGKPVPLDELPIPPGFPPLVTAPTSDQTNEKQPESIPQSSPEPEPSEDKSASNPKSPVPLPRAPVGKKQYNKVSRAEKQQALLQQRQHELKQAALNAKKDGDLELARNYLRQAKGMDPLIEASTAGLPVDMNSIPLSPLAKIELNADGMGGQVDDNFTLVFSEDCSEEGTGTNEQIYGNLEAQLQKQIKWCLNTRDHSKALGDVSGYNRWERLALGYKRDLDMLRVRKRDALPPPQHHYETKTYAVVQSCTDLSEGDIEISIIRGVNFSKEDTYVMFEFPFPSDNPPGDRTSTVKGTCNPEYLAVFPLTGIIDRRSRQCQRAFKRHALKCQVWAKGCSLNPLLCCTHPSGFFRSDSLLGTVTVKLQPLETHCELHDSFPLMDGRKPTGAKLELKIRIRNPILTKQIEQITDKWLIIDH
ncbi:coiled-coil and C2 domain-containing protein 1-like isoform X2 [Hylaeus anthracinus]|uniref:coiled-coil and C2 domain-containing protein 1-like isoform X2 n=1 Tax=Hylaeus anthracinus TaxID=313031 RepID=UPI0023B8894B|nr:coiled-coil and C2 domain-containing protein 1-like isoform X2 [Hylaeus anthracinus]